MSPGGAGEPRTLIEAAERLRSQLSRLGLPFPMPGVAEALADREALLLRLDGYVLPRLRRDDAPLVVVVGGSTGAGKSTLTNSLVGSRISPTGVLRPTTRSPVLVHHPQDSAAFMSRRILPALVRTTVSGTESLEPDGTLPERGANSIRLVPNEDVVPGLAIIDSPDLDSLVDSNRTLAQQLFAVADLWLFVTTGTDYADAVPWELLADAVNRNLFVAVVLDRMRESELVEVRKHFAIMLRDRGLSSAPVFTIPETELHAGLLPSRLIAPLQNWLAEQASTEGTRGGHVGRAVRGTLDQIQRRAAALADVAAEQVVADRRLRRDLEAQFAAVREELLAAGGDGSLVDERVREAWRPIAESPDVMPGGGRLRRRMTTAWRGPDARYFAAAEALQAAVVELVQSRLAEALRQVAELWRIDPAGEGSLAGAFVLPADVPTRIEESLRRWHDAVLDALRAHGARTRGPATADPAVLAVTTLAVGADASWVGAQARTLLDLEEPQVNVDAPLAAAREDLGRRLGELVKLVALRVETLLDEVGTHSRRVDALRAAAAAVGEALTSA